MPPTGLPTLAAAPAASRGVARCMPLLDGIQSLDFIEKTGMFSDAD